MKEKLFLQEMSRAKTFHDLGEKTEYMRGYMRGLRQRYHGANFGDPEDHERWLDLINDDYRRDMGRGYRAGYFGPVNWHDSPKESIRKLRHWRGWTLGQLAQRLGISPRTLEGYEQGRPIPATVTEALEIMHSLDI